MGAIGVTITQLRTVRGWSQAELARRSGLSQGHISMIEHAHVERLSVDTLDKLARALNVPLVSLLPDTLSNPVPANEHTL